ncbi:conserved hypothetical protein [Desulfotalea psychrophila LSv54]|uniref:Uncharacterized protein n=2 Tax=Desulfotalea psychrophila TaxID=84980 RepID=Q6ALQ7_DESPS|nr:conserved hypothetical protein [Desulfotalea psychrophila LSv54]
MRARLSDNFSKVIAEVRQMLEKSPWLIIKNQKIYYDSRINGLLPLFHLHKNFVCSADDKAQAIREKLKKNYGQQLDWQLINRDEIQQAIITSSTVPYKRGKNYSIFMGNKEVVFVLCENKGQVVCLGLNHILKEKMVNIIEIREILSLEEFASFAALIPIVRFSRLSREGVQPEEVLLHFLKLGLVPENLKLEKEYFFLMEYVLKGLKEIGPTNRHVTLQEAIKAGERLVLSTTLVDSLLRDDTRRADIKQYPRKIIEDVNEGHWELWPSKGAELTDIELKIPLIARDPASSIIDGVVGIDFGTKSTVVVAQKESLHSLPLRIGTGDLAKKISKTHYENPTIIEFNDLQSFYRDYCLEEGRPFTSWQDVTVSHTALNSLQESSSSCDYYSYLRDLKQWAGQKQQKINIIDKKNYLEALPPYFEIEPGTLDPLEIYAYYLGLYINNQHDGIYLNYYLSFPITYELAIRKKITASFRAGIRKSLPPALLENEEEMTKFRVRMGASEPAAYAITALHSYKFEPEGEQRILYGIFDFGGGTTDFDFGMWREAKGIKEKRYDYAIEHFGAGGDRFLGGEHLLELLAFDIFKNNYEQLQKDSISFPRPPECFEFAGSELLLANSREAQMNMTHLAEKLRPFWEQHEGNEQLFQECIHLNLWDNQGKQKVNYQLFCNREKMAEIIRARIARGVESFLEAIYRVFSQKTEQLQLREKIHIFLAGNSSQSHWVEEIFKAYIAEKSPEIFPQDGGGEAGFELFPPLGTERSYAIMDLRGSSYDKYSMEAPTGKTGVAFGLVRSRKGSRIKVIDHNLSDREISCPYYIGSEKKGRFIVDIDREDPYGKWYCFIDASEEEFEFYYTDQLMALASSIDIADQTIRVKRLIIDRVDEDAWVYLRKKTPTTLEYVVAYEGGIEEEKYLGDIQSVELTV